MKQMLIMIACAMLVASCAPGELDRGVAIRGVTVIDSANGVREDQTVIYRGDEIVYVGSSAEAPAVNGVIDAQGKYLIPGLWDMHVHFVYDDAFTADMPRLFLQHGITSVRDTGGPLRKIKPVIERLRADGAIAPRAYYSGPLLDGRFVVYDGIARPELGTGNPTLETARENVAALKEAGVDFIKIYEMVSPEVFAVLVEAAHDNELPIAAHVPLSMVASTAGPQVGSMEHLRNVELDCATTSAELFEERLGVLGAYEDGSGFELRSSLHALQRVPAIQAYDEARCLRTIQSLRGTIQVPTLRLNTFALYPPYSRADWDEVLDQVPAAANTEWREATEEFRARRNVTAPDTTAAEWSMGLIRRMHAEGVPIGAGTDTPIGRALPGDSLHTELLRLVEAGLSPLEALEAATVRPAEFLGLADQMGTIDVGKRADLVLLDANPLDDIRNTRTIHAVVAAGRFLDQGQLETLPPL